MWRKAANLTFNELPGGKVDILIDFFTGNHNDGDDNAFDGPGMITRIFLFF